jgi:5-(carboxyamino)imidazole ribonucleotide synthase
VITPPATLGVLGGGQLGRYMVMAARVVGYRTLVLDPDPSAPAAAVADEHVRSAFDDPRALDRLAAVCAAVTTEFENPPASALERLARSTVVAPAPHAVAVAQDRIAEKRFLQQQGFAVAPWAPLAAGDDLGAAEALATPVILKTARLGYDGRGQRRVVDPGELAPAWRDLGSVPCVVEQQLDIDVELSVVVARTADGPVAAYPVAENQHRDGILDLTVVPARVDPQLASTAEEVAIEVALALDYVGLLAVELCVVGGRLVVNELAPRPHNSGHWTLDAARTDQFAQQVRAVTGAALGSCAMTAPAAAMVNLLGDCWPRRGEPDWSRILADPSARLHLYGKSVARAGRKMGHVTVVGDDPAAAVSAALDLRETLVR